MRYRQQTDRQTTDRIPKLPTDRHLFRIVWNVLIYGLLGPFSGSCKNSGNIGLLKKYPKATQRKVFFLFSFKKLFIWEFFPNKSVPISTMEIFHVIVYACVCMCMCEQVTLSSKSVFHRKIVKITKKLCLKMSYIDPIVVTGLSLKILYIIYKSCNVCIIKKNLFS